MALPTSETKSAKWEILTVSADQPELVQQCMDVRIAVFVNEQKFSLEFEKDEIDDDPEMRQFLVRVAHGEPAGTIRLSKPGDYYKLSRLAVLKEYRGKPKFGTKLVEALHEYVKAKSAADGLTTAKVVAHAQDRPEIVQFYINRGYEGGEKFIEDDYPHLKMVKEIHVG